MLLGQLDTLGVLDSQHIMPRQVDVWLPESYSVQSDRSYPVVYMHDGQNLFQDELSFIGVSWGMDIAMTKVARGNEGRTAIVVAIWNTPLRVSEYMPQKPLEKSPELLKAFSREEGTPCSDAYLAFLTRELIPLINQRYRTIKDAADTFIAGSSMGGLLSLYAVCEFPQFFGGAACLSTAWPVAQGVVVNDLEQRLPPPGRHRFYFDLGTEGLDATYPAYQKRVDSTLGSCGYVKGRDWTTVLFEGDEHSERAWRKRVHIPMTFLLAGTA